MEIGRYNDSMYVVKDFLGTQSRDTICTAFACGIGSTEKDAVESFCKELELLRANIDCAIKEAEDYMKEQRSET